MNCSCKFISADKFAKVSTSVSRGFGAGFGRGVGDYVDSNVGNEVVEVDEVEV